MVERGRVREGESERGREGGEGREGGRELVIQWDF